MRVVDEGRAKPFTLFSDRNFAGECQVFSPLVILFWFDYHFRTMYAIIEKNKLKISIAEFYMSSWYDKKWPLSGRGKFEFEYGNLEIDVHKGGKKYLTGFVIDPRKFIVDYLKTRYKKELPQPKQMASVSIDSSPHTDLFTVDFFKARSFVVHGMEKDLIFPQFVRRRGKIKIQGFEVLSVYSMLRYFVKRFKYRGTTRIRKGDDVYDFKTGRRWKIERKRSPKK